MGIGEGGSLNNTDIRGAYTREAPSLKLAAPLLYPREADGMDVSGGGAVIDAASSSDLASETYYRDQHDTSYLYEYKYVDASSDEPSGLSSAEFYESLLPDCAKVFSIGECEKCHRFTKVHMCGKEWCLDCGEKDSWIHKRRFSRWLGKAQQMRDMGYYVIEWPVASRHKLHSKQVMSDIGKRVKGAFQALGYDRGLRRWHFFGEYTDKFNPHINVLVESAYLSKRRLEYIKSYLRLVLDEPDLIVNYSYRQSVAQKVHTLKYVTRATFLDLSWDSWLARDLFNFQNTNYWGKWKDAPVWEMSRQDSVKAKALESLESGKCPHCGTSIRWDIYCVMDIAWLKIWQSAGMLKPVGGGYFELLDTG
ncbi:MAG: hypothetical protein DDT33_01516 [Firmicutes bacterium]|nr:hypothetical protein [Bacillota bacterium]